jgi:hypothetical protein
MNYICKTCNIEIIPENMHNKIMCISCWNDYHNNWQKNNKDKVNRARMKHYNKYYKTLVRRYVRNGVMYIESK